MFKAIPGVRPQYAAGGRSWGMRHSVAAGPCLHWRGRHAAAPGEIRVGKNRFACSGAGACVRGALMGLRRKTPPGSEVLPRAPGDPLPADLLHWIAAHFAPDQHAPARACLEAAVTAEGEAAAPRLLRCAALASRGELARLQCLVQRLRQDWRDVVVEGEYTVSKGRLVRVRDLSGPLAEAG
jgi:hypothetical protein